ncbi:hypothetical protein TNCV_3656411 [Trichonephila clavipes]|nr:hypothetical protein TNCV_3656411 [Trichonephila clavipes]
MEEEAEKYYIIRGLKDNRAIEIQLQSCSNIEELNEKMKLLDIQEKSKSNNNMEDGIGEMTNLNIRIPKPIQDIRYTLLSFHHLIITLPFTSAADPISEKPTISTTTDSFATRCSNFLPRQRTQNNNTVLQPHQT